MIFLFIYLFILQNLRDLECKKAAQREGLAVKITVGVIKIGLHLTLYEM